MKYKSLNEMEDFEEFREQFLQELYEVYMFFHTKRNIPIRELMRITGMHSVDAVDFVHGRIGFKSIEHLIKTFYTSGMTIKEALEQYEPFQEIASYSPDCEDDNRFDESGRDSSENSPDTFHDDMF